eukprot:1200437-Pyramimonas_sp.AAC.1
MPLAEVYAPMSRHHLRMTTPNLLMPRIAQGLGTSPDQFEVPALDDIADESKLTEWQLANIHGRTWREVKKYLHTVFIKLNKCVDVEMMRQQEADIAALTNYDGFVAD